MSVHVAAGEHHTFRANEHDTVLSEVAWVQCVLMPRAFLVAGFSEDGQVMLARYQSYAGSDPAWDLHFFEHELMTEKLLGVPQQLKAIFIGSNEQMLVPDDLYDVNDSQSWMKMLNAVGATEVLHTYAVASASAQLCFALPEQIDKLLGRYFGQTRILPLQAYQFYKPDAGVPHLLQCLVAENTVLASVHNAGKLKWYGQFSWSTVEDIAWQAAHLCRELHIARIDLHIHCAMLSDVTYDVAPELERFFPKMKWSLQGSEREGRWAPVVFLLQQLYACAL